MKFAVIRTGGKQYIVKAGDEILVDKLLAEKDAEVELEALAEGDLEKHDISLGTPVLKTKVKAQVIDHVQGDKVRVARFKSKVRSRKVLGFRAQLSKIKIVSL